MNVLEILGQIGFDTKLFIFNLINFIIVGLILKKFFFGKIVSTIEERKRIINEGIENAQKAENDLNSSKMKANEIVTDAKREASLIIGKAADDGQVVANQLRVDAEKNITELHKRNKEQLAKEKDALMSDFKKDASDLVLMATEKLLQRQSKTHLDKSDVEGILNTIEVKE